MGQMRNYEANTATAPGFQIEVKPSPVDELFREASELATNLGYRLALYRRERETIEFFIQQVSTDAVGTADLRIALDNLAYHAGIPITWPTETVS